MTQKSAQPVTKAASSGRVVIDEQLAKYRIHKSKGYTMSRKSLTTSVNSGIDAFSSDQVRALYLKDEGIRKRGAGDGEGALRDLNAANGIDPHNADILTERGIVNGFMLQNFPKALEDFDEAHKLKPCSVDVLYCRALAKMKSDDNQGALEDINSAHELDPNDAHVLRLQDFRKTLCNYQGAVDDLDGAHMFQPYIAFVLRERGILKGIMEDKDGSSLDLHKHNESEPKNGFTLFKHGTTKYFQGDFEGALRDLNRANVLEPNNASVLRYCGIVRFYLKAYKAALRDLDKSNELEPNNSQTLAERGRTKHLLGDREGALLDLNKANEIDPNDAFTLRTRAFVRGMLRDHEGALQDADKTYALRPSIASLRCRAFARHLLKNWQGAERDIGRALELDPSNVHTLGYQADLKRAMGDYHGALDALNKGHELQPNHVDTLKARATLKHLLNDFQGSLCDLDKAHDLEPRDAFILKERVALKVMTEDYQGALIDLDKAHHLDPDEFTRGIRRAVTQNSQHYLKAMANLLQKVLHGTNILREKDIVGSYEVLSSEMSFLLEVTTIILQMTWMYYAVMIIFVFEYLMGYVERGQWGTYSNGSWEFRATYTCIELRLGAYPFQKFRELASSFPQGQNQNIHLVDTLWGEGSQYFRRKIGDHLLTSSPYARSTKQWGIHYRCRKGKQGVKFDPRVSARVSSSPNKVSRIYFGEFRTLEDAILVRDVAHYCLGNSRQVQFCVDPAVLKNLAPILQGQPKHEIKKLVLERVERAKELYSLRFKDLPTQDSVENSSVGGDSHSDQQGLDPHWGDNIGGLNSTETSEEPMPLETPPSEDISAGFAEFIWSFLSTPINESFNARATKELSAVGPPRSAIQSSDPNVGAHVGALYHQIDAGVGNMSCSCKPFLVSMSPSGDLWTRQIIIKAPAGTNLQHNCGSQFELPCAPTFLSAFSALDVFTAQGWALSLANCSIHSQVASPSAMDHVETNQHPSECFFRIRKSGTTEELVISNSIRTALDQFGVLGWEPLY